MSEDDGFIIDESDPRNIRTREMFAAVLRARELLRANEPATDIVRHNVGTCPACRQYLWMEVDIARQNGRAIAGWLTHVCDGGH